MMNLRKRTICTVTVGLGFTVAIMQVFAAGDDAQQEHSSRQAAKKSPASAKRPVEDLNEPDVAKRTSFVQELSERRQNFGCFLSDTVLRKADDRLSKAERDDLINACSEVVSPDLLPEDSESVIWWQRNLYPPDTAAVDWVVGEWTVRNRTIRVSRHPGADIFRVLMSLPGSDLLGAAFADRPAEANDGQVNKASRIVSRENIHLFLNGITTADLEFEGVRLVDTTTAACAGVDVHALKIIRPAQGMQHGGDTGAVQAPASSGTYPTRLLIVDSDPQYVCLLFDRSK